MAKKILVVDDDEGILGAFQAMLESVGYEVKTTPDADYLLKLKKKDLPDLILLDVLLSGADGRDVCKFLRSQKDTKGVPVIIVSAHPSAEKSIKKVGANDFLAKPFKMSELLAKVEKHLR